MPPTDDTRTMMLTSRAFTEGRTLLRTYSADGADVSPALQWHSVPAGTRSFAIICRDLDAPGGSFVHWVMYNIPGNATALPEALPKEEKLADGSIQGRNDFQAAGYNGPKPPPGKVHSYHFDLFALDAVLPVESGVSANRLKELMKGHVLGTATLMGTYRR